MDLVKQMREDQARACIAVAVAAGACGARADAVAGGGREIRVAFARQVAMYLASVGFGMSLGRVARAFGRDRSTVRHACRVMEERRENPGFDRWMDALEASVARAPVSA
ncbi:MAG: helix-turn-helix domain-containing protein [Hyphomonadaceae bacterium]|nr:helix-turn-helix domain-containing protein [Hyphomonadaceae bacterium]